MLANSDGSITIKLCVKYNLFRVSFGGKYLYSQHFTELSSQRLIARKQKQWKKVSSFFVCVSCTYKSYYSHNHALGLKLRVYYKELFHPHLLLLVKELCLSFCNECFLRTVIWILHTFTLIVHFYVLDTCTHALTNDNTRI